MVVLRGASTLADAFTPSAWRTIEWVRRAAEEAERVRRAAETADSGGTAPAGIPWPTIGIVTGVLAAVGAAAWFFTRKKKSR